MILRMLHLWENNLSTSQTGSHAQLGYSNSLTLRTCSQKVFSRSLCTVPTAVVLSRTAMPLERWEIDIERSKLEKEEGRLPLSKANWYQHCLWSQPVLTKVRRERCTAIFAEYCTSWRFLTAKRTHASQNNTIPRLWHCTLSAWGSQIRHIVISAE